MRTTTHILNHQRSGNMLELTLDEEIGGYRLRFHSPPCADADFLKDLRRWVRAIGRGWQKRNGHSNRQGQQAVTVNFSTKLGEGKFKPKESSYDQHNDQ
jgi:hypothetical protein